MSAIGSILHPTDFSPQARHAFALACALGRGSRGRLVERAQLAAVEGATST